MSEVKPIKGFEGRYSVYADGRIYSHLRNKFLSGKIDKDGYIEVALWDGIKSTHRRAHRLVAEHFIPNPDNLPMINHKDNNPANNVVDNLEWCTNYYNQVHKIKNFTDKRVVASLEPEEIRQIVVDYQSGMSLWEIHSKYKLENNNTDSISEVLAGRKHTDVTGLSGDIRRNNRSKVSEALLLQVLEDVLVNKIKASIAAIKYGLSDVYIHKITHGIIRKDVLDRFMKEVVSVRA